MKRPATTVILTTCLAALIIGGWGCSKVSEKTAVQKPDTRWYSANPEAASFNISTAGQLAGLAQIVNGTWGGTPARDDFSGKTVRLAKSVNLSPYGDWAPIGSFDYGTRYGTGPMPLFDTARPFSGTFDGGGNVIKDSRSGEQRQGLFGYVRRGRVVDLRLDGVDIRGGELAGCDFKSFYSSLVSMVRADSGNRANNRSSSAYKAVSPKPQTEKTLHLIAIIDDSCVTPGVKGDFMPRLCYREFHRYITRDGLDTLFEYTAGMQAPRHPQTGREFTIGERFEIHLYAVDSSRNIIVEAPYSDGNGRRLEKRPLSVYDALKEHLAAVKERYSDADDADDITIAAEKEVSCDKIALVTDAARGAGYTNIAIAAIRSGSNDDDAWPPPVPAPPASLKLGDMALTGGRNPSSVRRVVFQNMAALRQEYVARLREKPGLAGKVSVKFAINDNGKVISARVVETTINDAGFERAVVNRVKSWKFGPADESCGHKSDDVTEVTYPFVFSQ